MTNFPRRIDTSARSAAVTAPDSAQALDGLRVPAVAADLPCHALAGAAAPHPAPAAASDNKGGRGRDLLEIK